MGKSKTASIIFMVLAGILALIGWLDIGVGNDLLMAIVLMLYAITINQMRS